MSSSRWLNLVSDVLRALTGGRSKTSRPRPTPRSRTTARGSYPGDYTGTVRAEYSPALDGNADPGEVVWTWVPYEDDATQGKDRPVLVVGRDGSWLLVLMLTSKDHDVDAAQEARWGRYWQDIGTGPWDSRGRPSEVRLDRVIRIDPATVRREGAIMPERTFNDVIKGIRRHGH
ncbi:type II toxin-antitoxin system PemK/MazF family toxin [Paraoerskovia marina]|uniref:type II toxin-antitoxin system PemK/MazF family toxin n=1 Tax=Paraoerskovia marina TaxID=545619 RepID=UPI0005BA1C30|nr:type II toxin-antitoxin system PemK/MazF family toxin [Paraoerskovia marina]